ncbi:uncharacterized protein ACA1_087190, partial [Acanthamoeba castellanii str. Neff]
MSGFLRHLLFAFVLALSLPTPCVQQEASTQIYGGGSIFTQPYMDYFTESFQLVRRDDAIVCTYGGASHSLLFLMAKPDLDFAVVDAPLHETLLANNSIAQFPLAGQPLVAIYNLGSSRPATPLVRGSSTPNENKTKTERIRKCKQLLTAEQVLDGATLAAIWLGDVTWWNDPAIVALNPNIALPAEPIRLGHGADRPGGITHSFTNALSILDGRFRAAWSGDGSQDTSRWPQLTGIAGRAIEFSDSGTLSPFVRDTPYSLSYSTFDRAQKTGVDYALMRNSAGAVVWPTVKAVESAISEVSEKLTDSMTINVANGQQRGSWPMCMLHYLAVRSNASTSDCLGINSLLYFTAWTQLTPMAVTKSRELGYAPLSLSFKAKLINNFQKVACNGEKVFDSALLIGTGVRTISFSSWPQEVYYFRGFDAESTITDLSRYNIDFGITARPLTNDESELLGDVPSIPFTMVPVGVAYNLPELVGQGSLLLNLTVLADILLGTIDTWNDTAIQELNPELGDLLPADPIVILNYEDDALSVVFAALSTVSQEFALA